MKKNILFLITIIILSISCRNKITKLYIQFGEAKVKYEKESNDNSIRIYFDRNGFIYPDKLIDNFELKHNFSLLKTYYRNNKNVYSSICKEEKIDLPQSNFLTLNAENDKLQEKLVEKYIEKINAKVQEKCEIVFIIHGYNDNPTKPKNDNSYTSIKATRDLVCNKYQNKKFQFVEIYWDGMSKENGFQNFAYKIGNSLKIWDNSNVSATYAALELRRIISKVNSKKMYIITHSHGAALATNSLFNIIKFKDTYYENEGRFILERYKNVKYNTPTQDIYIGMLAPAIPGVNVFDEYFSRTNNGYEVWDENAKNYHFIIGFNKYDMVTRKFYTKSSFYGSSTLACNLKELQKTKILFCNDVKIIESIDFSHKTNGKKQFKHDWLVYLSNEPCITYFFDKLFK